ncbi:hypothetical protein [Paraflavitalea speifideaquila]|uniref:hypothetical protein n=1 Tax=Paraflavitalea speifideaquila TaxID=3076558 RepID=UPI0028ED54B7|nr:hypothetical protein [Paraflavitalea speifideiaquila]
MHYEKARDIAISICEKLAPNCERVAPDKTRINIAGSIRRQKYEVKDIEVVCQPLFLPQVHADLFGATQVMVISPRYVEVVAKLGKVIKGEPTGRYMQIVLPQGINLDLFMPVPDDYYRQLAIRTGSADYVARNIAVGWNKIGWVGTDQGLRKKADCIGTKQKDGKILWKCINPYAERPPAWQSEREFFDWIKVPCIMPKLRTI